MQNVTNLLQKLTPEELSALHKILESKSNEVNPIMEKLGKVLLPANGLWQTPLKYSHILDKIAKYNNIQLDSGNGELANEQQLFLAMFQKEFNKMSDEEKAAWTKDLEIRGLNRNQIASLTALGTIGAAQASGFGIYMIASSTVGAIASLFQITLPFAFYTGMSTVLSVVIGPIGFLVLGYAFYRSFKNVRSLNDVLDILSHSYTGLKNLVRGDYERATLSFKYIASMRVVLQQRLQEGIKEDETQYDKLLENSIHLREKRTANEALIETELSEISKLEEMIKNHRNAIDNYSVENTQIQNELSNLNNQLIRLKEAIAIKKAELEKFTVPDNVNTI
ncbi:MAG: hypothetical protein EOO51_08395 [Flavobacterium sp.]|nr:MAG: hypothetical protein EOO51_08395 [Flavobacterium sp.]